jgi:sensor histidine kinase YesM
MVTFWQASPLKKNLTMSTGPRCPPAHQADHPLDAIALFRRWPPSPLRNIVYTFLWNSLIALFLAAIDWSFSGNRSSFVKHLLPILLISNVVGYLCHAALVGMNRVLRGWPERASGLARLLYYVLLVGLCVIVGIALGRAMLHGVNPLRVLSNTAQLTLLPFALLAALFMFIIIINGQRRIAGETLAARQSEQLASAAQLLAEARLRALQAQIEPHFLYNTLANVLSLIEADPPRARHMLERFIDYLRASLAASRAEQACLGAELDLVAAYLDVLAVRMGPRLHFRIEADPACRALPMAPMLLQPLVENALTHGLEPSVAGGTVVVRASMQGQQLCIEVCDNGIGLSGDLDRSPPRPGHGVGLSNLRARLRSLYHGDAQVQLLENQGGGITARLLLPITARTAACPLPCPLPP